ncbi:MAG: hypothetical protein AAF206_23355 [Bacteroidota bacterium]
MWLFPTFLTANTPTDSLREAAHQAFNAKYYAEATTAFEALLAINALAEQDFYRLAFLYEEQNQPAEAVFCLRSVQVRWGGPSLDTKINQLVSKNYLVGTGWTNYRLFLYRWQGSLLILCGCLILLSLIISGRSPGTWRKAFRLATAGVAIVFSLLLVEHSFFARQKAVMLNESPFFSNPAYAGEKKPVPVGPGSTLELLQSRDIWSEVRIESHRGWVPTRSIRTVQAD